MNGVAKRRSGHSFDATVARLVTEIESRGAKLFAVIDHAGEATRIGLTMPPTKVLIFGSPKAGTALMLAAPTLAIDLPLKVLVWEERSGSVWMAYNTAEYLAERHGLATDQRAVLAAVEVLVAAVGEASREL